MEHLREPKRKRVGSHIKPQQPFPILIESESGIAIENELGPLYIGNFTGDCVVLCNPEEIISLYTMGFFGKGSYSRGYPSFGLTKKGIPPIIKERQWQRRKTWMEKIKNNLVDPFRLQNTNNLKEIYSGDNQEIVKNKRVVESKVIEGTCMDIDISEFESSSIIKDLPLNTCLGNKDDPYNNDVHSDQVTYLKRGDCDGDSDLGDKLLVLADSDDEDIEKVIRDPQPHLEDNKIKTVVETLNLTLEEAFFLSYALGCLQVIDMTGQSMTLKQLWNTFCEVKPDFIESYVVYHYFRAKGWVVKSGYKFGGDFLLYKQGPPFYHASYIVLVEKVDSQLRKDKNSLTWTKLHGLNRLAESSGKDVITCQVVIPDDLTKEDLMTPKSLSRFQVNEVLTKRWISSQEREEKDQTQAM